MSTDGSMGGCGFLMAYLGLAVVDLQGVTYINTDGCLATLVWWTGSGGASILSCPLVLSGPKLWWMVPSCASWRRVVHWTWRALGSWLPTGHFRNPQPLTQPPGIQYSAALWPQGRCLTSHQRWLAWHSWHSPCKRLSSLSRPRKLWTISSRGWRTDVSS